MFVEAEVPFDMLDLENKFDCSFLADSKISWTLSIIDQTLELSSRLLVGRGSGREVVTVVVASVVTFVEGCLPRRYPI